MPRFYRRYGSRRYGYRRGYRRYGYRRYGYRRGYASKYANASSRSQTRIKTTVYVNSASTLSTAATPSESQYVKSFSGYFPSSPSPTLSGSAIASPLYRTYCSLYEEVKCIGMKVNLSVSTPVGGTVLPSLQIFTAWDRRAGRDEPAPAASQLISSSTYAVATALNNNVAKVTRSCFASDLIERAQWHDCTIVQSGTPGQYLYNDSAWVEAGLNPNFFAPGLIYAFQAPYLAQEATVNYTLAITYYMAFRNPKFGTDASDAVSTQAANPSSRAVLTADDDAGTMDVDEGDIDSSSTRPTFEEQWNAAATQLATEQQQRNLVTRRLRRLERQEGRHHDRLSKYYAKDG
ncbi:capsid [Camdisavirus lingis]|uniref:Capsid n=1 Tax=Macaca fascicularis stool-associated virus TaxID=2663259 RepID=A0A5P9VJZ2_9VIRU|nr:capsid [Macaca fascicularis stool-associated virus]